MRRGTRWIAAGVTTAGAAMLWVSWALTSTRGAEWFAGALVNGGTAVLLFVPLYIFTRRLDRHIEEVRDETSSTVDALSERVSTFEADVDRRLDDVARSVAERLSEARGQDAAAFAALRETPSRAVLEEAMQRAKALGLVDPRGPRVCVIEPDVYVRVHVTPEDETWKTGVETIEFGVEPMNGNGGAWIGWAQDETVDDVMFGVGREIERRASGHTFDVSDFFVRLAETLEVANLDTLRRPIIQLCPPQWAVTSHGLVPYGSHHRYHVEHERLRDQPRIATEVAEKGWVDPDSFNDAHTVSLALFPKQEGPPF